MLFFYHQSEQFSIFLDDNSWTIYIFLFLTNVPKEVDCSQVSLWGLTDLNVKSANYTMGNELFKGMDVKQSLLLTIKSLKFRSVISNRFSLCSFINIILSPFILDVEQLGKVIKIFSPNFISSIFFRST